MTRRSIFRQPGGLGGSVSAESLIGMTVLILLALIAVAVLLKQSRYDPAQFKALVTQAGQMAAATGGISAADDFSGIQPEGISPMSETETFGPATLSDKIDGKSEGYLDAGFRKLTCRRFVSNANPNQWFEFFLYDMGTARNAFSIYSKQKREGVKDRHFTEYAYSSENAVFFATGRYYVEIIAASRNASLMARMTRMAKNFVQAHTAKSFTLPELAYLPQKNLDTGSVSLIPKNGFGYRKFDNIVTGTYQVSGKRVMAFVSIRKTPEAAAALVAGYNRILSDFVGDERLRPDTDRIPGLVIVNLFGEYELFFSKGNILAGVHGAPDKKLGEAVAVNLYNKISDMTK